MIKNQILKVAVLLDSKPSQALIELDERQDNTFSICIDDGIEATTLNELSLDQLETIANNILSFVKDHRA